MGVDRRKFEEAARLILEGLGVDLSDENFRDTPKRFADIWEEFAKGSNSEVEEVLFTQKSDLVIVSGIRAYSFCPHHLLPIEYKVHVAYRPSGKVIGLSKIPRIVHKLAQRLVLQERITEDIADEVARATGSNDVLVIVEGRHFCMLMRGPRVDAKVVTEASRGAFSDRELRKEVLMLMGFK